MGEHATGGGNRRYSPTRSRTELAVIWPVVNPTIVEMCPAIRRYGLRAVAVMPDGPTAAVLPDLPNESDWDEVIVAPEEPGPLADVLAGVGGVLAGDEVSVPLAESVARLLGLPGNDPRTSRRRRDKAVMTESLAAADLAGPVTVRVGTLDDAVSAAAALGWPVVVKPPSSAGSDGFGLCNDVAELASVWERVHGRANVLGEVNDTLLVQEALLADQYTVNTVSVAGPGEHPLHVVTDAWLEDKPLLPDAAGMTYSGASLLFPSDPLFARLVDYSRSVLDAVGIVWGPGHIELRLDASGRPSAIDVAARLPAPYPQHLLSEVLGLSQVEATLLAVTDPGALARRPDYEAPSRAVGQLFLVVPRDDMVIDGDVLAEMAAIPGVDNAFGRMAAGAPAGPLSRTIDLMSSPGGWNLIGDVDSVESAKKTLRGLEKRLYRSVNSG